MAESEENSKENPESIEPRVTIGPHPLGGIAFNIRDLQGKTHQTRIDLPEATILSAHLTALITMTFSSMYAEAARGSQIVGV